MNTVIDVRDYGAVGNGQVDNGNAVQLAINDVLIASVAKPGNAGLLIYFPPGVWLFDTSVVPAFYDFTHGQFTPFPGSTVSFTGAGTGFTTLMCGQQFRAGGLVGYGRNPGGNPVVSQFTATDLTFDGNYVGAGGLVAQPGSGAGALVSLPWPGTSAAAPARTGRYHRFTRCRFYRPSGYGTQPTQGFQFTDCEFDHMGQPDQGSLNYDNLGSGPGDAIVKGCTWHDSTGNYADFVGANSGDFVRILMSSCESFNHTAGGVYACGSQSVIVGNSLKNTNSGSGIGYDAGTINANRSRNVVSGNCFVNLALGTSGLSAGSFGDLFTGLNSSDG
jgi:hypothetical protein